MDLRTIKIRSESKIDIRCPICGRKNGESLAHGSRTGIKCVRCDWEFEFHHLKPYAKRISDKMEKK